MATMLSEEYSRLVAAGELRDDPAQEQAVEKLDRMLDQVPLPTGTRWFGRGNTRKKAGIYLWGPPGLGKTMLMDMFFRASRVAKKWRVHFHDFMIEVHQQMHRARKTCGSEEALSQTAAQIANRAQLLCLDEMQIVDIADAMIVGRLFDGLLKRGVAIVTTSNVAPNDLYMDGLNRQLFLPFVRLIEEKLEVVRMDGLTDYRLGRIKGHECFISPLGADADRRMQQIWERLTDTIAGQPMILEFLGRKLRIPQTAKGCARFNFTELCEAPLGAPDYLAIAQNFRVVFLEGIPVLDRDKRNEVKRFILLIDTLYDKGVKLVTTAEAPPDALYPEGKHSDEFRRTISRLQEMRSASWWGGKIAET